MTKNYAKDLYLYLKKRCPNCSGANVEIIIDSEAVRKTDGESNSDDYKKIYNRIDNFDEKKFEIIALGYTLDVLYEELDYWTHDEYNPNKIHLHLRKAVVLYPGEKIALK